jgi:hypothetical protein
VKLKVFAMCNHRGYDAFFINWNMRMTKLLLMFDVVRAEVPKLKLDDVLKER